MKPLQRVVIDTNVILDNPSVLLRDDIKIILPYVVLSELDGLKKNPDLRVTAQQAIKIIKQQVLNGSIEIVDIPTTNTTNDEKIVDTAKTWDASLWTGDVGASVIAMANTIPLFDDLDDSSEYDADFKGYTEWEIPAELYYNHINKENKYQHAEVEELTPVRALINEYVLISPDDGSLNHKIFRKRANDYIHVSESKKQFASLGNIVDGGSKHGLDFEFLHPEQAMAFDAVFNIDTPLAVVCGEIGSGKTLLSTIAALARVAGSHANKHYEKILVTRPNRPISKAYEIGFLPGDADAKLKSWLSGFTSNLEFLYEKNLKDVEDKKAELVFHQFFKSVAIESIQGASFHNSILLVDEAQLLDVDTMKQIMSRLADTSKCILILDPKQAYSANRGREGFKKLLRHCKGNELISFVDLQHIQRSPLTKLVQSIFE